MSRFWYGITSGVLRVGRRGKCTLCDKLEMSTDKSIQFVENCSFATIEIN